MLTSIGVDWGQNFGELHHKILFFDSNQILTPSPQAINFISIIHESLQTPPKNYKHKECSNCKYLCIQGNCICPTGYQKTIDKRTKKSICSHKLSDVLLTSKKTDPVSDDYVLQARVIDTKVEIPNGMGSFENFDSKIIKVGAEEGWIYGIEEKPLDEDINGGLGFSSFRKRREISREKRSNYYDDSFSFMGDFYLESVNKQINFYKYKIDVIPWDRQHIFTFQSKDEIKDFTVVENFNLIYFIESKGDYGGKIYAINNQYLGDEKTKLKQRIMVLYENVEELRSICSSDRYLFFINGGKVERCLLDGSERRVILRWFFGVFIRTEKR